MLIKKATHKIGAMQRKLAMKYDISVAMVNNILKKNQIKYSKIKAVPKYYPGQQERAQKAIRKLRRYFFPLTGYSGTLLKSTDPVHSTRFEPSQHTSTSPIEKLRAILKNKMY